MFFLAGDAFEVVPERPAERLLIALTAGLIVAFVAIARRRWGRSRVLFAVLGVLVASPFVAVRCVDRAYESEDRQFRRMPPDVLAAAPSVLLVTADSADIDGTRFPAERWEVPGSVFSTSTRRDPALASLLTGQPVITHRVLFDGDPGDPPVRGLSSTLAAAGFRARVYGAGALPDWARRDASSGVGSVAEACRWIADRDGEPRFAHVHVDRIEPESIDGASRTFSRDEVVVVVASLVGAAEPEGAPPTFLDRGSVEVLLALRHGGAVFTPLAERPRPRSLSEVHESIARAIEIGGAARRSLSDDQALALDDLLAADDVLAVTLVHGTDERPHRIRAEFADAVLDVSVTPLGGHPTDDWALAGPTAGHLAYRNVVRVTPKERVGDRDDLIERLARWRRNHARREWRREDPDPR